MTRKPLLIFGGVAVLAIIAGIITAVAIQMVRSDDVDLATEAPDIPASVTQTAGIDAAPTTTEAGAGTLKFVIDKTGSKATYVVREKLANLPVSSNAVGETSEISGELYLSRAGLDTSQQSTFKVDLRTLKSDESRRDRFVGMDM